MVSQGTTKSTSGSADLPATAAPTTDLANTMRAGPARPQPWFVRYMAIMGLALAVLDAILFGVVYLSEPEQVWPLLGSIGALFAVGKEAAIPTGIFSFQGQPVLVGFFVWLTDLAAVALFYPLVHAGLDGAQKTKVLGATLRAAHRRARRKRVMVERFGPIGLYLFLIIPFAFNSPVVGMVLGRVSGISAGRTILVLLAAISTTALAWTLICIYLGQAVPSDYTWIPFTLSLTVTAVVLSLGYLDGRRERRREQELAAASGTDPDAIPHGPKF